jgi:site-specific DNA-methyltransferase (adenine-specific)
MSIQDFGQRSRTPDILECLANLSNDEVFTPPSVVNSMLDLLPEHVWTDPDLHWLDIGCKTGVYLREIAKRLVIGLAERIPDPTRRVDHILGKMLYGVATTQLTGLVARRTLYSSADASAPISAARHIPGFGSSGNIRYVPGTHAFRSGSCSVCGATETIDRDGKDNYAYEVIHTARPEQLFHNEKGTPVKFNIIVANPPYQMNDGGNGPSAKPLYHQFVQIAMALQPDYISMIIPARWYAGGKNLDDFRKSMKSDRRISHIVDAPNASEVFPDVEIKGGVMYFLWDAKHDADCQWSTLRNGDMSIPKLRDLRATDDIIVRSEMAENILTKVKSHHAGPWMDTEVSPRKPFGLDSTTRGAKRSSSQMIPLYQNGGVAYIDPDRISKNLPWVKMHKVLLAEAGGDGMKSLPNQVIGRPFVAAPDSACTETYLVMGTYSVPADAERRLHYIQTKFFRYMLSLRKITHHNSAKVFAFVPALSATEAWSDERLFKHFGLSDDEVLHIIDTVKDFD